MQFWKNSNEDHEFYMKCQELLEFLKDRDILEQPM